MRKLISALVTLGFCCAFLLGCSPNKKDDKKIAVKQPIHILLPKSAPSLPLLRMIEAGTFGDKKNTKVTFYTDYGKLTAAATNGEYTYIVAPSNILANLYNKGIKGKFVNVAMGSSVAFVTTDSSVNKVADLKSKKLYVPPKGSLPSIMAEYFLETNGVKIDDVEFVYSTHQDIAGFLENCSAKYAVDVQPYRTRNSKNVPGYRTLLDFSEDWGKKHNGQQLPNFSIMKNIGPYEQAKSAIDNNSFDKALHEAMKWCKKEPTKAVELMDKNFKVNKAVMIPAMTAMSFNYMDPEVGIKCVKEYYKMLADFKKEKIGGKVPDENFYK